MACIESLGISFWAPTFVTTPSFQFHMITYLRNLSNACLFIDAYTIFIYSRSLATWITSFWCGIQIHWHSSIPSKDTKALFPWVISMSSVYTNLNYGGVRIISYDSFISDLTLEFSNGYIHSYCHPCYTDNLTLPSFLGLVIFWFLVFYRDWPFVKEVTSSSQGHMIDLWNHGIWMRWLMSKLCGLIILWNKKLACFRSILLWLISSSFDFFFNRFGHHDVITSIDSLTRERAITSGGRDASIRIWKIVEESQLVFNGHG